VITEAARQEKKAVGVIVVERTDWNKADIFIPPIFLYKLPPHSEAV
jgi:hypothetical protein